MKVTSKEDFPPYAVPLKDAVQGEAHTLSEFRTLLGNLENSMTLKDDMLPIDGREVRRAMDWLTRVGNALAVCKEYNTTDHARGWIPTYALELKRHAPHMEDYIQTISRAIENPPEIYHLIDGLYRTAHALTTKVIEPNGKNIEALAEFEESKEKSRGASFHDIR